MGIVNATPDSFSDGGEAFAVDDAVRRGLAMADAGADILDIGGESTRPGAEPVGIEEECRRVLPVVKALSQAGAIVSIDTRHARTMAEAIGAGARIVNDVTALEGDAKSLPIVAASDAAVILMHMKGDPRTMQRDPRYGDVVAEVRDYLAARVVACEKAGIHRSRIAIDPGIGFGKTVGHNLALIADLAAFRDVAAAVVLGVSRKSFIAKLSRGEDAKNRLGGSLAAALAGRRAGADIVRVHDVAETVQAIEVWDAIANCGA